MRGNLIPTIILTLAKPAGQPEKITLVTTAGAGGVSFLRGEMFNKRGKRVRKLNGQSCRLSCL
jgi:hypothetical protein